MLLGRAFLCDFAYPHTNSALWSMKRKRRAFYNENDSLNARLPMCFLRASVRNMQRIVIARFGYPQSADRGRHAEYWRRGTPLLREGATRFENLPSGKVDIIRTSLGILSSSAPPTS